MARSIKYFFLCSSFLLLCDGSVHAERVESTNLLGYTGYLTIPSAYISHARWSFSYSYFSQSYPLNDYISQEKNSELWNFSSSLGLFPFMEILFSVYVVPQENISSIYANYGANKWRTLGVKLRIVDEKKYVPAVALGTTDPDIKDAGASLSAPNIPSSYIVLSKKFGLNNSSFSIGYGFDYFVREENRTQLHEVFGGINMEISNYYSLLCDYDGKYWSLGSGLRWKNFDLIFSYTEGNYLASRFGYNYELLKGISKH